MKFGCYSEYVVQPENGIISKIPENISFKEVVPIPFMGIGAFYFNQKANIQKGKKIIIYGASGAVGTYAVQLAKYFGAEVTGICSTSNLELVKSFGADKVIDYTKEDFLKYREQYEVFFDAVGKCPFSRAIRSVKKGGIFITANRGLFETLQGSWVNAFTNKKVIAGTADAKVEDLNFLKELLISGKLITVIDRIYTFKKMPEAHKYVDRGHKKGNVMIKISGS